jgi:hypothetical protein
MRSGDTTSPFVGILSTAIALSATVADLARMDATPMSKLESKATVMVLKIFTFFLSYLEWFRGYDQ